MKTYKEILKDIEKARANKSAAEKRQNVIIDEIHGAPDLLSKKEARSAAADELKKVSEKILDLNIAIKLLKNNARVALFNELKPVISETFNKYAGKPYGEKTRAKISDEIHARTGCRCYIYAEYLHSQRIEIYSGSNDYNITVGYPGNSEQKLLIDNKVQAVDPEQLQLYYIKREYFDDIPAAIKAMKKAYKKALEKQKELETICEQFNFYAVDGIERIYKDKYICPTFRG